MFLRSLVRMRTVASTPIVPVSREDAVALGAERLSRGDVIAVPTDTIYGFACDANSEKGVKRIYEIKRRDESKPIAICVDDLVRLRRYGRADHLPGALLERLLPGPVTIVLRRTPLLNNSFLNPGTDLVGIRIPDCDFIRDLARTAGLPVALTSANPSSAPSCLTVAEFAPLHPLVGLVFDGGDLGDGRDEARVGSTVVDLSVEGRFDVIRRGISCDAIVEVLQSFGIVSK